MQRGRKLRRPFLDITGLVALNYEQGLLLGGLPSRTTGATASSTSSTTTTRATSASTSSSAAAPTVRAARGSRRHGDPRSRHQPIHDPQRRPAPVPRQATSTSRPATAAASATPATTRRTGAVLLGKILRINPRNPRGQARLPGPAHRTRSSAARPQRDLQLRAAQPLALLLRPGHREAAADRDRRRRPGAASRRSTTRRCGAPTAPSSAGTSTRASPVTSATARCAPRHGEAGRSRLRALEAAARSSAATWSATGACARSTGATSSPTSARGGSAASSRGFAASAKPAGTRSLAGLVADARFGEDDARRRLYVASARRR